MSKFAYKTIDRRSEYYTRAAPTIAVDPVGFYTRAERGRAFQADLFPAFLRREYERREMLDAAPTTEEPDYESDSRYVF